MFVYCCVQNSGGFVKRVTDVCTFLCAGKWWLC